jgi:hypothetical protein
MIKSFFVLSVILSLVACNLEPKVSVADKTQDCDLAAIELTTQVEGEFIGFEGENEVIIKYDGEENTYEIAEDATGDFETVKEGNNIAFSTKMVDGKEMFETLRLN